MNVEIVSLNPFIVEMNLYNLLGDIDGHPRIRFDMKSGEFTLIHDKTYANLVSTSEHPLKGQPLVLADDSPMWPIVRRQVSERIGHTGFHDKWATEAFNKHYVGDLNYPRYFFTMWDRKPDGEIRGHLIKAKEYKELWEWESQQVKKLLDSSHLKDYGCNPLPNGMFQMVPSGKVVSQEEKESLLEWIRKRPKPANDCLGLSWEQIERMQGGKLKRT